MSDLIFGKILELAVVVVASIGAYFSYKANVKVDKLEHSVNGKMEKLLQVSNKASKAEGVLSEKERQKNYELD